MCCSSKVEERTKTERGIEVCALEERVHDDLIFMFEPTAQNGICASLEMCFESFEEPTAQIANARAYVHRDIQQPTSATN